MTFSLKFSYLFALISSISCLEDNFTITRMSSGSLSNEVDVFNVPESQCTSVSKCSDYGNAAEGSATGTACTCKCLPHASTFGRHDGSWSCLNNTEMRELSGCRLMFTSEHDRHPFRILKKNENPLPSAVLPSLHCSIDMSSTKYFTCDGTWAELDPNGRTISPLRIFIKQNLSNSRHYKYLFTVINVPSLKGKLISIQFKCRRRSQSSCLIFKMEGEFKCLVSIPQALSTTKPVAKPTRIISFSSTKPRKAPGTNKEKGDSNRGGRGTSSGTVAAVVTIVVLVILLAVVIGFVIWKIKKGERLRIIDRLARLGKAKQLEPDENIYAEIAQKSHEQPTLTRTEALTRGINNCSFGDSSSTNLQQWDDSLYAEADLATTNESTVTDAEGYLMPVDSPMYLELQPPKEDQKDGKIKSKNVFQNSLLSVGDAKSSDSHCYDVLEDPNAYEQSTNGNAEPTGSPESDTQAESCRGSAGSSIDSPKEALRPADVRDSIEPVLKNRRRPPSPPRKGRKGLFSSSDEDNKHDGLNAPPGDHTAIEGDGFVSDYKDIVYESLKDDKRVMSVYESLDRTTALND